MIPCNTCQRPFEPTNGVKAKLKTGEQKKAYCSPECRAKASSECARRYALKNRAISSERMKKRNPMRMPGVKQKMMLSRSTNGIPWSPPVRGGNGRGSTLHEKLLMTALGQGWGPLAVATRKSRALGYPCHYKIDVANKDLMVAIEVDGNSHHGSLAEKRDSKKTQVLTGLGWRVFRFSNKRVERDLKACLNEILSSI